jgi:hypothetical protein
MKQTRPILLGIAFLLELIAFFGFCSIEWIFTTSVILKFIIFIVLFILLTVFWSLYMAPRAIKKFEPISYYQAKTVVYTIAAISIFSIFGKMILIIFIILSVLDEVFLYEHNLQKSDLKTEQS